MGDCGCRLKAGCSSRKGTQAELLRDAVTRLYPTRRWPEIDDVARFRAGVPAALGRRLERAAARQLKARVFFREGGVDDLCDFLWILCVGREPSLLEMRERPSVPEADSIHESYLRVALSQVVRAATIQEVQLEARWIDRGRALPRGESLELVERTRDGVYDPVLLGRMQKMVGLLGQAEIAHLDFGMLCEDAPAEPAIDFGDYREQYGAAPTWVPLLFFPQPPILISSTLLELPS